MSLPHIFAMTPPKRLTKMIQQTYTNKSHLFIVCDINSEKVITAAELNLIPYDVITVIIGPEGGFGELDKNSRFIYSL